MKIPSMNAEWTSPYRERRRVNSNMRRTVPVYAVTIDAVT